MKVGDAWAARRGHLLNQSGDLNRRVNARALGFKEPDEEMEQSDELVHACHAPSHRSHAAAKKAAATIGQINPSGLSGQRAT